METVTDAIEARPSAEERMGEVVRAEIVDLAEAKRQLNLNSRQGKLKQARQAHENFLREHVELCRLPTNYKWIDENGTICTETVQGINGGSRGGDCLSVTTAAKAIRPRKVALEIAMNKLERLTVAMLRKEWHLVPKDMGAYIDSLWETVPPVVAPAALPPAAEAE